jgi:hypothetical protein
MKKIFTLLFITFFLNGYSHEGMWLPTLLNIDAMQAEGLKLSAEDIYSINHSSLKDAIVHFGGGCTAEIISDQGLLLTNHHCGYSRIQAHSSLENDYLKDGFWAMSRDEELTNPGLTATFIVQIIDVTEMVLDSVNESTPEKVRAGIVKARSLELVEEYTKDTHYNAKVVAFNYGNSYYLFLKETFKDVRLVGAPPSAIGKFGGDTDNWVWPRHTGDFSIFRIYTDPDGKPAEYNEENIPLKPKHYLPINIDGVNEGDFTMVYGFPGRTFEYIHSNAVDYTVNISNPMRIEMRKSSLKIIDGAMDLDDAIRIKYAAKQSWISNSYKKWIGQNLGLEAYDAIGKKRVFEDEFQDLINSDPELKSSYGNLLKELGNAVLNGEDAALSRDYFIEFYYYGPELFRFANGFMGLVNLYDDPESDQEEIIKKKQALDKKITGFFKNYNKTIDQDIFNVLWPMYHAGVPDEFSVDFENLSTDDLNNTSKLIALFYEESIFSNEAALRDLLNENAKKFNKKINKDPVFQAANSISKNYSNVIKPAYTTNLSETNLLMRKYTQLQKDLFFEDYFWPDANSTLRLTFGRAEGSIPRDGMLYTFRTTLDGIIQKNNTGNKDFIIPKRLRELWQEKDYGQYADGDELPVCFLGSNHTTGGNSGSPAIDANGNLVGLNFDRTWESTMSDIMFDPLICRNIMVDVRYILFIIDKYAGAGYLVEEMTLVHQ